MQKKREKKLERLLFATHNVGKVKEIKHLLADFPLTVCSARELGLPDPEETGSSFYANALLKARSAAAASNLPVLADDSGLSIASLNGAPGIFSARWAEQPDGSRNFKLAMEQVLERMSSKADRSAWFICALALVLPNGEEQHFCGRLAGTIAAAPRGQGGFGYDPIFIPAGEELTLAEIPFASKQRLSHRWRALQQLVAAVFTKKS